MAIFDYSKRRKARKIFSTVQQAIGRYIPWIKLFKQLNFALVDGIGDFAYNPRRGLLAALIEEGTSYNLYNIEHSDHMNNTTVKLLKKAKWRAEFGVSGGRNDNPDLISILMRLLILIFHFPFLTFYFFWG